MTFLHQIQKLLERTYAPAGVDLEKCLVNGQRYRELSAKAGTVVQELSSQARTFLRVINGNLYLAIYYHPEVISALEEHHPFSELSNENIHALIVFIEEIDHALHGALLFHEHRLEIDSENLFCNLELQAKVDTYLTLKMMVGILKKRKKSKLTQRENVWIQHYLFKKESFDYQNVILKNRYLQSNRLGLRLVKYLDSLQSKKRVELIRRFRTLGFLEKRKYIQSLHSTEK